MVDKRKYIRVSHENRVTFIAGAQTFAGKSVDISRGGMMVQADIPGSHCPVNSVSFHLPESSEQIHLQCKAVWGDKTNNHQSVVGIEFSHETEAQVMLIDNFIKEKIQTKLMSDYESTEKRKIPRTTCFLTDISTNRKLSSLTIDNISSEGCLLNFDGPLFPGDGIDLEFCLAGDPRKIKAYGVITYVIEHNFKNLDSAGVLFTDINDVDQKRIYNFIVRTASTTSLKALQETISKKKIRSDYQITHPEKIGNVLTGVMENNIFLNLLFEDSQEMLELNILKINTQDLLFETDAHKLALGLSLTGNHASYFSFYFKGGSYYFRTTLVRHREHHLTFALPPMVYQSEKRAHKREIFSDNVDIFINMDEAPDGQFQGKLVDISRHGFLCELPLDQFIENAIKTGQALRYLLHEKYGLDSFGEIRHITKRDIPNGDSVLQIGVESGISRSGFTFQTFQPSAWKEKKISRKNLPSVATKRINSKLVTYPNSSGKKIAALINSTDTERRAPVVILPPAFGKKKETLSPLVSTLIANYRHFNQDITTIRYDGVNRPGESYNDEMFPKRGYEMLHYKLTQGMDDLKSTLHYVYNNSDFKPSMVILVAFSMSALDARKIILDQNMEKVDYLISVMGATCGQSSFGNVLGGIDIIGNSRMGIQTGLSGVLGHLLDVDSIAKDLIDNKYAYITDARSDMSKISIPVTWIYGKYDKWIPENEIKDIMGVSAGGMREIIEIPTGHNLRSSDDAIKAFRLITKLIYRMQHNKEIEPIAPDREEMVRLITYERERLNSKEVFRPEDYWKNYLIGKDRSGGYDFYKNIKEFLELFDVQSRLINLEDADVYADMGCGTGLFTEHMLMTLSEMGKRINDTHLVLVDLVPEALEKTRAKCEKLFHSNSFLCPRKTEFVQMDLDPNRLIPVDTFVKDLGLDFNYLRNRIDGLMNLTIDHMLENATPRLYTIMRGATLTHDDLSYLKGIFNVADYETILEFNRAARFVKKELTVQDMLDDRYAHQGSIDPGEYQTLQTDDIIFKRLNFNNSGLNLNLDFSANCFDKIVASLFVSYLYNPDDIIYDFYRMLKPGGRLLVSSMKPDSDISQIFTDYISKVQRVDLKDPDIKDQEGNLNSARNMLNEAAALFELEEDGYFKFFSDSELVTMFEHAGFKNIKVTSSMGKPEQVVIITGEKY